MNSDTAIEIKDLYKNFMVYYDKANTIKERLIRLGKGKKEEREILKDINWFIPLKSIKPYKSIGLTYLFKYLKVY